MKKQILFRADGGGAGFDNPAKSYIHPTLCHDDLEGMRALTYIEPVKATKNRLYLRGWGNCGTTTQNAALDLLKRLAGSYYKDAYYGSGNLLGQPLKTTTGEYIRLKDSCSDIGFLIDYREAVVNLYSKVKGLPKVDDSDQGKLDGHVYYSVPIPTRGGYMGFAVPWEAKAWQDRLNTIEETETNVSEQNKVQAANDAAAAASEAEEQHAKNQSTFYRVIRYASLAVIAAVLIFLIVKIAKKKK